jgi:hypothetical protein
MNDDEFQICVNVGNAPFFYKGVIIKETDFSIILKDRRLGEVEIFKSAIVSKQKISNVED